MNIEEFRSRLGAGGARPNQLRVTLNFPTIAESDNTYSILVSGAAIPASTVNRAIIQYRGREIKLAGERIFDPWTVTVFSDAAWQLRGQLEQWSNLIQNMGSVTTGATSPEAYYGEAIVRQMDRNEGTINSYTLYQIWPQVIDPIDLAYDANDVVEEFGVTWRYNYMTSSGGGGTV